MILDVFFEETTNTDVVFVEAEKTFDCGFSEGNSGFAIDFGELKTVTEYIGGEVYDGDYTVTPKIKAQTMPTENKVMVDDVTVKAIPFFNVSNTSGGKTVYIGEEV